MDPSAQTNEKVPIFEPVSRPRDRQTQAVQVPNVPDPSHEALPMTIPGTQEMAAKEVDRVSPEGRPALSDAKGGPGRMVMEIAIVAGLIVLVSVGIGAWFGLGAGLAALAVGALALVFNPVIGATAMRAQDRAEVINRDHSN